VECGAKTLPFIVPPCDLAFTRYCFTSSRVCTNQSSTIPTARLHCPPCCNTIARLLGNLRSHPNPPCVCHSPYNISNNNVKERDCLWRLVVDLSSRAREQILALTLLHIHTLPGEDALVRALCPGALRAGLLRTAWRTALCAWC